MTTPCYSVERVPPAEVGGAFSNLPWRVLRNGVPVRRVPTRQAGEQLIRYWRALGREPVAASR